MVVLKNNDSVWENIHRRGGAFSARLHKDYIHVTT